LTGKIHDVPVMVLLLCEPKFNLLGDKANEIGKAFGLLYTLPLDPKNVCRNVLMSSWTFRLRMRRVAGKSPFVRVISMTIVHFD